MAISLLEIARGMTPMILYSHTEEIPLKIPRDVKRIEEFVKAGILASVGALNREIFKKKNPNLFHDNKISKIYCVLSSLWFVSQVRILSAKKASLVTVTEAVISKLVDDEQKKFMSSVSSNLQVGGLKMLEHKILSFKINGYDTTSPIGKKGNDFALSLYLSATEKQIADKIEDAVQRIFHYDDFVFITMPLVLSSSIADAINENSYLAVDITGEVTDLVIVKSGSISEIMSFPLGENYLIAEVAKELQISPSNALSHIKNLQTGVGGGNSNTVKKVVDFAKGKWKNYLEKTLSENSLDHFVPATAYVIAEEGLQEIFSGILRDNTFNIVGGIPQSFTPRNIDYKTFSNMYEKSGDNNLEPLLAASSMYVAKINF